MSGEIEYYKNQISLARAEIKNLRQQLTAFKNEHVKEIKLIKSTLNGLRCNDCAKAATTIQNSHSNAATTSSDCGYISYKPIGVIDTTFQNKRAVPRQPSVLAKAKGTVVIDNSVFNNPEHALSSLDEFSHIWILYHFHATESTNVPAKVTPPRLGGERRGVFSTRAPHRPCPIGLSLVKIHSIEGNKIHFLGVDMVKGTPVLDIKPYIPQYDYPVPAFDDTITSLVRPPTEGISDAAEAMSNLQVDDESTRSLSPRIANPIGINANSPMRSAFEDDVATPGNVHSNPMTPVSPSPESPSSTDVLDGSNFRARSPRRPETERGAPDGQERFTPPQSAHLINLAHDGIRVAPWISNPPSQTYDVRFSDDALDRLNELIGNRAQSFKSNIETLLAEDPRSHYVRNRYPDHEYNCVLEDLSISCVFDANTSICTIVAVRNAEDLQN